VVLERLSQQSIAPFGIRTSWSCHVYVTFRIIILPAFLYPSTGRTLHCPSARVIALLNLMLFIGLVVPGASIYLRQVKEKKNKQQQVSNVRSRCGPGDAHSIKFISIRQVSLLVGLRRRRAAAEVMC